MGSLGGKTAFISAATSVVGTACARLLAAEGARVCVADADHDAVARLAAELQAPDALGVALDMQDEASWTAALQRCAADLQAPHIVVLCSGAFHGGRPIVDTGLSVFREALYGSGFAAWLGQKQAVLALRAAGDGGAIIHVTSLLGRIAAEGAAGACAGSAGVVMSARAAALECAKAADGIVVNTVLSGPVAGDDGRCFPAGLTLPDAPTVAPEDVAAAVLFYATAGAAYMTGTELPVDGGRLSR